MSAPNKYETLITLRLVAKLADSLADELKEDITNELKKTGQAVTEANHLFSMESSSRRSSNFHDAYSLLSEIAGQSEENAHIVASLIPDLFTVKVTGLDRLAAIIPGIKDKISAICQPIFTESLKITEVGKVKTKQLRK